ncbi:MAG TPA: asparagine synthase (glutamine-hydrolyzing) [Steroidobacteraceae bacterium]
MCGIAGIATRGAKPPREVVRSMCQVMVHRGPDGEGFHVAPGIGLGMRRLAIIDLTTGDQPVSNQLGTVRVVFNGEIYNYRELRAELIDQGHSFRSTGDGEVIPHLYEEYGLDFIKRLNGMFAIALWDARQRRLLLTRDRVGIKPLFYSLRHGNLYFGSEVKCILAADGSTRETDPRGVDQLLTLEYTASPTTLFKDVRKLPPGSWLTWCEGELQQGTYWSPGENVEPFKGSLPELTERLRVTVTEAVRRQLVSDVPLGAFLSGGIDSSILVAAMSEVSPTPPKTFSVGFGDASYSELHFADIVARHCGTEHRQSLLTPDYLSTLPQVVQQLDQPIADFSVFPTLLVARMAREHVTVALGGDGGDELFGGYDTYAADRYAAHSIDRLPRALRAAIERLARVVPLGRGKRGVGNQLRRFLEGAALPVGWQHMRWATFLSDTARARLYRPAFRAAVGDQTGELLRELLDSSGPDRLTNQILCDMRLYLPENILPKVDLMSMATSLEARVPYLDNEVIDLALSIPAHLKVRGGVRKWILKKAFAGRLPPPILARGKEGFSMPMKNWLNEAWNDLMHELLGASNLLGEGIFDARYIAGMMREHEAGTQNHSHTLWALMVYHLWRDRFARPVHEEHACTGT